MANRKRNLHIAKKRRRQRVNVVKVCKSNTPEKYTEEEAELIADNIAGVAVAFFILLVMCLGMLIV